MTSETQHIIRQWFKTKDWKPFDFQQEVWENFFSKKTGLLDAPTGSGKTYAVYLPVIMKWLNENPSGFTNAKPKGLRILWLTPLRALARDTENAIRRVHTELNLQWTVERRTGDSSASQKKKIYDNIPNTLITTPESLHILIARSKHESFFKNLDAVIVDEWHELLASKRGVMTELGLSRIRNIRPNVSVWGVSATLGNMEQAWQVLHGAPDSEIPFLVQSSIEKKLEIETILPDKAENYSWAGHLGGRLLPKILPIVGKSKTTLLFTNTRSQAEIWYQQILDAEPDLAGQMALHHGSLDVDIRSWVENAIHDERLKLVVSTSSLDLGVDFSPVETVVQVGSPKGVARFLQRAGRSGHSPGATSRIYFVPTNTLEIVESAALKYAVQSGYIEERNPIEKPLDLLLQYICTRAVGGGFRADELFSEIVTTYAFRNLCRDEFDWCLRFLTTGGKALGSYEDYSKLMIEDGIYFMTGRRKVMRHRLSIGTITADPSLKVKFLSGGFIGTIEDSFISKLNKGDVFLFAGRYLEFVKVKELTVYVRKSKSTKGMVSRWMGGRMELSSKLSDMIRLQMEKAEKGEYDSPELKCLEPLFSIQAKNSIIPKHDELLIERLKTREGWHLFFYTMEGRVIHEGMAAIIALRLSRTEPISFSIAMNDYGFELLSDREPNLEQTKDLFGTDNLLADIYAGLNHAELARRHFREIARISGLTFSGYPGNFIGTKQLQASSSLLFDVFSEHDKENLLLKQSYDEIMARQLHQSRIKSVFDRINHNKIRIVDIKKPTPFCFPIMVDRLRGKLSSEKLENRILRMKRVLDDV